MPAINLLSFAGLALVSMFVFWPVACGIGAVIPVKGDKTSGPFQAGFVTLEDGTKVPITPLTISGEYYPGGPLYEKTGPSLEAIYEDLEKDPMFNATAFEELSTNTTAPALTKRAGQLFFCNRRRRNQGAHLPDITAAINHLNSPRWKHAFCYAGATSCAILVCHGTASIYLCTSRGTHVRVYCGDVVGSIAQGIWTLMNIDYHWGYLFDDGICRSFGLPAKWYSGYSWWSDDSSWDVRIESSASGEVRCFG
ncbi:hypothetical protein ABW19_dt0202580 [Dactylella cylindrospora]|nr:hypothetical protein ABW19_dt0202580 [Dactylella cylindrospora]